MRHSERRPDRARRAALWAFACAALFCIQGNAWAEGSSPWPSIHFELDVPSGTSPVIITETDTSGLYKVLQVGTSTYKLINFDSGVLFQMKPVSASAPANLRVIHGGGGGEDDANPWPTLVLEWFIGGQPSLTVELDPQESDDCANCDRVYMHWE
ncbi:hypothetical protein ABI59_12080 [Acidobacteria bacterium Mor1]|nr:hypothetical protein ABI59_12080 [Acidobacteria bacterium Mor1]